DITINFITSLLIFYNIILVVINRFIKYIKIILFKNNYTILELVQIILNRVVKYYKLL
ncbi:hypothetical protein BS50DRAFT_508686, partial [Corynespora cassiicola Philippines]